MTAVVRVEITGTPQPQGSKTGVIRGDRVLMLDGKRDGIRRHKEWRATVHAAAAEWVARNGPPPWPAKTPVRLAVTFLMPRPKSRPRREWWVPVKPDLSKLLRAVEDGLETGGVLHGGDSRVAVVVAAKRYTDLTAGAVVEVSALDPEER